MPEAQVEILGVYRLPVTEELFREQYDALYGYDRDMTHQERAETERRIREHLDSTVLIEALVKNRDSRFDMDDFTQPCENLPRLSWQAAYAEAFLALDGESLAVERWTRPPKTGDLRVAFFLHFWDAETPLRTSYGDVTCPSSSEMPDRLRRLVPYEPTD